MHGPKIGVPSLDIHGPKIDAGIGLPDVDIHGSKINAGIDIYGPKICVLYHHYIYMDKKLMLE